ncbi:LytR/AlgR family response regulator transcription factor [Flammeovirga agarivorans]|uniref:Response regulator transcription factor n=1 Tax=Flammeovirga agarivorans TaxID=2726742 RepID=A0A7X8SKU1_9BACT|nr:LytTR family DNA-binding domain-containing protein [Flammeovirga agarivorans]NLR92094.1 response regulator transcription factor [Flammeovirga agarivorans]
MKALIIEDEKPAQGKLLRQLNKTPYDIEVVKYIDNVSSSVKWLSQHQSDIDLIFMDIHLTDGIAFDILKEVQVVKPIIFTTAYDEYALDAFKANSIDYLLKPVDFEALTKAIQKLEVLQMQNISETKSQLDNLLESYNQKYKERFMVRVGDAIKSITVDQIIAFVADGRHTFIYTQDNRRYVVDFKMEELTDILDPEKFFRTNRSFIVQKAHIKTVEKYTNSRLLLHLVLELPKEVIVGREKVKDFKNWFDN